MKKYKVSICTLGCRVNQYESDSVAETLELYGYEIVRFGTPCDATIINTCTVTAESDRKSRQLVRKAVKWCPGGNIVVTGCSAEIATEEMKKIGNIGAIIGNGGKASIPSLIKSMLEGESHAEFHIPDIDKCPYDRMEISRARRTKAYIKIEDGCENRCAYCIIPKARGKIRSKDHDSVIREITEVAKTTPEIILTGIEVASYGKDKGERSALEGLIKEVSEIPGVKKLGCGSLDPNILTDSFIKTIKNTKEFMPHLHLSIQSGCTGVLNRMRRKYTAEKALARIKAAREAIPEISYSADVICGFPGETEEEFLKTVEFCREARFMHLHIFPYSVREGTEAAAMENQVPEEVKKERCRRLAEIQAKIKNELLDEYVERYREGGCSVLFEQIKDGLNFGHSDQFIEIKVKSEFNLSDRIVNVRLTGHDGECCFGEIL